MWVWVRTSVWFWPAKKASLMVVAEWSDCDLNWKDLSLDSAGPSLLCSAETDTAVIFRPLNSQTKNLLGRFARGALSLTILIFLIRYPDTCRTYIYHVWPRLGDRFLCRSCCQDVSRSRDRACSFLCKGHVNLVSSLSSAVYWWCFCCKKKQ